MLPPPPVQAAPAPANRPRPQTFFDTLGETGRPIETTTSQITNLLRAWGGGDEAALIRLTEQLYPELRLMARRYMKSEAAGHSLQATALVHELYLRLVDVTNVEWRERGQFFAIAAQIMRRILVDAARRKGARRRDGIPVRVNLDESAILSPSADPSILALDDALTGLAQLAPRQAKIVELRYFGGLTEEEIEAALEISPRTIRRDWDFAKAWLRREMDHSGRGTSGSPA